MRPVFECDQSKVDALPVCAVLFLDRLRRLLGHWTRAFARPAWARRCDRHWFDVLREWTNPLADVGLAAYGFSAKKEFLAQFLELILAISLQATNKIVHPTNSRPNAWPRLQKDFFSPPQLQAAKRLVARSGQWPKIVVEIGHALIYKRTHAEHVAGGSEQGDNANALALTPCSRLHAPCFDAAL
jgi:hypothetical protein